VNVTGGIVGLLGETAFQMDRHLTQLPYNSEGAESLIDLGMAAGSCQSGRGLISLGRRTC